MKERITDWSFIEKPMSGQEIANELGISRQAVSQCLKRALKKMYNALKEDCPDLTPSEVVFTIMCGLDLYNADEQEIVEFFRLFPKDIKQEIMNSEVS